MAEPNIQQDTTTSTDYQQQQRASLQLSQQPHQPQQNMFMYMYPHPDLPYCPPNQQPQYVPVRQPYVPRGRPFSRRGRGRGAMNFNPNLTPSAQHHHPQTAFPAGPTPPFTMDFNQGPRHFHSDLYGMQSGRGYSTRPCGRGYQYQQQYYNSGGDSSSFGMDEDRNVADRNVIAETGGATSNVKNRPDVDRVRTQVGYKGSKDSQTGTMMEQLTNGTYECTVCCESVQCNAPIWNCQECYTVFHLKCIKKWAKTPGAETEDCVGWFCPMCRKVTIPIPHSYKCFCNKLRDPPFHPGEMPHSCGEVCRRRRAKTNCLHPCNILCHPGPCPPCATNLTRKCLCKKTAQTVRCGTTVTVRCETTCGKMFKCGAHVCQAVCHDGDCEPCQVSVNQGCYCDKDSRTVLCSLDDNGELQKEGSHRYSCSKACGRKLTCGHHDCKRPCHPGPCDICPFTPDMITHCPCGQTALTELANDVKRTSCLDDVPTCQNTCSKPLLCGGNDVHSCKQTCHSGACLTCPLTSIIRCRCGHRMIDVLCRDLIAAMDATTGLALMSCDRKCTKKKNCRKHKCNVKCCVDQDHHCKQVCGRMLNCGKHRCEDMCHPGSCVRCLNASFDEYVCHCGAVVVMPPIHCGTKPPDCSQLCVREHDCNHPVRHTCHNESTCPPCAELTSKMCMGYHEKRYNIPCHIKDISCGHPCGKRLQCEMHACPMICHKGNCDECKQPCKVARPECGHPCMAPCHPRIPCPTTSQCKVKYSIHCACGIRSETVQCLQGGNAAKLREAFQRLATSTVAGQSAQSGQDIDITQLMALRDSKKQRQLECDEHCAVQKRNKRLAEALDIKNPDSSKMPTYNAFLKEQAKKNPTLVKNIEKELLALVNSAQSSKHPSRSHAFPSMNRDNRRLVHELSEVYGCKSQSYDEDPNRNVVTTAKKAACFIPSVILSAIFERESHPKIPMPVNLNTKYQAPPQLTSLSKALSVEAEPSCSSPKQTKEIDWSNVPVSWDSR